MDKLNQKGSKIAELIEKGREQGYLTYSDVNDHLPDDISDPEYDVIVSTGEQSSSALISLLLNKKKIESRSLLGWQIPIMTDGNHSKARIVKINSKVLRGFLKHYRVLVIAGFQGISEENRITTLGRGGSDTSARRTPRRNEELVVAGGDGHVSR